MIKYGQERILYRRKRLQLKTAQYSTGASRVARVAYILIGDRCTFTALQPAYQGSTINYAEKIIKSICEQENLDHRILRFYDLQTSKSYSGRNYRIPDSFQYDEVILDGGTRWVPTLCPNEVIEAFSEILGKSPVQVYPTGEPFR